MFGSALDKDFDQHIINAMKQWKQYDRTRIGNNAPQRKIAISVYRLIGSEQIISLKNRLNNELSDYDIYYFDSGTHPLSDPQLTIDAA